MKNIHTKLATIALLTVLIISGGYGIISLLQYKATKINNASVHITLWEDPTSNVNVHYLFD